MPYQVPTAGIEDSAVNAAKIATDAVGTTEIIADGVRTADIQNSAVTTDKINNDAVTYGKIQNVVTANRVLGSTSAGGAVSEVQVQTAMIANSAVTTAKINDSAVTTAKINDESVTLAKLDPSINFFPSGGIVMWSGTIANIPTDWVLCDGNNGTPDLRNRFIVGAHSGTNPGTTAQAGPGFNVTTGALADNYEPGDFGGETAHQLTEEELASHGHTYAASRGGSDYGGANPASGSPSNGTTDDTGDDHYHENRPPYYALAFIMKT
jgi:hypothetical protein